jgi:glycosyltransferase involved in cell wall biosynthesis
MMDRPLVQVRTPTYKRPQQLRRALQSLRDQTWPHWVVDVYDDDREQAAREVCAAFDDPRIRYHHNAVQKFASANIDQCFSAENPNDADYFCVVEDDNFLLPPFMEDNIALSEQHGVALVLRNQLIEHASGTGAAHVGSTGVLDHLLVEGLYDPARFRMSLLVGIGVSNGGLFWSRHAVSKLEIGFSCTATIQEYMRTFSIDEPIYVAMTPLAVWAENAEQTTRNAELSSSYLRRELDLKRRVNALRHLVWNDTPLTYRQTFLSDRHFVPGSAMRSRALTKALIVHRPQIGMGAAIEAIARGVMIRTLGQLGSPFDDFVRSRRHAESRPRSGHADQSEVAHP